MRGAGQSFQPSFVTTLEGTETRTGWTAPRRLAKIVINSD